MRKWLALLAAVAVIAGYSVRAGVLQDDEIPGVEGDLILIVKDAQNAQAEDQISANVGDKIEITWSYPVVPGSIPSKAGARSDSDSVKFDQIRRVYRPKMVGSGTLGAFYEAQKAGKSTITFTITTDRGDTNLEVEVNVR